MYRHFLLTELKDLTHIPKENTVLKKFNNQMKVT